MLKRPSFSRSPQKKVIAGILFFVILLGALGSVWQGWQWWEANQRQLTSYGDTLELLEIEKSQLEAQLASASAELEILKNEDQKLRNDQLQEEINNINQTYRATVTTYQELVELRDLGGRTTALDQKWAAILTQLSRRQYEEARTALTALQREIATAQQILLATRSPANPQPDNVPTNNAAPDSGYRRQTVQTNVGSFVVDIVTADLNSTRVIVDTASDGTCANDCPVLSVGEYAARSGAYAAINGSYFCPASYPDCAGKTNSFDTLLMNKNKVYFNSDNNVYSNVPAVIFNGSSARFVRASSEWGRDTGVDAVLANQPLLTLDGQLLFAGDDDAKRGVKSNRSFIGATDNKAYMGVVRNATVAEAANVLHALGIKSSLNLDSGGSTALWSGGYKAGPGRAVPNAILFVRK